MSVGVESAIRHNMARKGTNSFTTIVITEIYSGSAIKVIPRDSVLYGLKVGAQKENENRQESSHPYRDGHFSVSTHV